MASPQMSLKLLINKECAIVLFAEVPKEFVDFLFQIFSLPLGTLIEFLESNQTLGSLGKVRDSMKSFPQNYLQPGIKLDDIFNLRKTTFNGSEFLLSNDSKDRSAAYNLSVYRANQKAEEAIKNKNGGYVKELVTYMVMDDLTFKPMSAISCVTLINQFGFKDTTQLEEKIVSFGKDEGLKLLNAALKTNQVLTSIFLH